MRLLTSDYYRADGKANGCSSSHQVSYRESGMCPCVCVFVNVYGCMMSANRILPSNSHTHAQACYTHTHTHTHTHTQTHTHTHTHTCSPARYTFPASSTLMIPRTS